ncbi:anthranilate phosphoribosyltransferase [Nitrosomonadaceae bacterium]|nr:anthranilate phosphoribosyltransferase [Nitrosomonadaceae bacterium]
MKPQEALMRVIDHHEILHDEMRSLMDQIIEGKISPELTSAIIVGLRVKRETIGEIVAASQVMRNLATKVDLTNPQNLVDTCGTGGDAAHTFNISTAAAFVAAAAGARIAKHGGRSVSSKSGSADVLEALGVNINQTSEQVAQAVNQIGVGFMFAPNFHGAMKNIAPIRHKLGVRTLFNILGPLTNPAGAKNQVLGVFSPELVGILVHVLQRLNSQHVMVVHGHDGLDEITTACETRVGELRNGEITEYSIKPEDFGIKISDISTLEVQNSEQSKDVLLSVLENQSGPALDIVLLNAGATIYVSGITDSLKLGVEKARIVIKNGLAREKLQELIQFTNRN